MAQHPFTTLSDPPATPDAPPADTLAARAAARNWAANLDALSAPQRRLASELRDTSPGGQPVFARDGSLTVTDDHGRWWAGCSLPARAAAAVLKSLEVHGAVACLLAPPHAAYLRVALDLTRPGRAIIALVPDAVDLRVMLGCDDFSAEIRGRRLWFAWGGQWAARLRSLFDEHPGLPTPAQFIRLPFSEPEEIDPLVAGAQAAFAEANAARAAAVRAAREAWAPPPASAARGRRVCVVAGRHFRLWDDAPLTLAAALGAGAAPPATGPLNLTCVPVCPDDPAEASPLALLSAAAGCDAVVTADTSRGDFPDLLPERMPWVTWVTTPRLPPWEKAGPRDALLVADPDWRGRAVTCGWPAARVAVARWPLAARGGAAGRAGVAPAAPAPLLALIADTHDPEPPARIDEFSSHRLLWNSIREELGADPLLPARPGAAPADYLRRRREAFGVCADGLDVGSFLQRLILPCYAQGVARLLLAAGLPLVLFGSGWDQIPEFAPRAAGAVSSREALAAAVSRSAALIHAWPAAHEHPIDAAGRPVVRGADARDWVRAARLALLPPRRDTPVAAGERLSAASLALVLSWG